jgi:hypothetical protein
MQKAIENNKANPTPDKSSTNDKLLENPEAI